MPLAEICSNDVTASFKITMVYGINVTAHALRFEALCYVYRNAVRNYSNPVKIVPDPYTFIGMIYLPVFLLF